MFANKFLASLASVAVALPLIGAAPQKAEAATSYCYQNVSNASVCVLAVHSHKTNPYKKLVKSSVNGQVTWDQVLCNPAHRSNYKRNLWGIACFEFN